MELNRQIYKTANDFTYYNQFIFNKKGLSEYANDSNYKFNQEYNKMLDVSFCYGMSKGAYSPYCNLKLVAVNLNVNSDVTKIQIDDFKQNYAYMFANSQRAHLENTTPAGIFGDPTISTDYREDTSPSTSWGKSTAGSNYQALFFYNKFMPAVKFNYAQICLCPEFECYQSIDDAINYSNFPAYRQLNNLAQDYKYVARINSRNAFYKGREVEVDDRIDLCGINNIKVNSYKSAGLTGVDIELANIAKPDISLNNMSYVGNTTPRQYLKYGKTINAYIQCPKPFEILMNSTKNILGTVAPYTSKEDFKRLISCYGLIWCNDKKFLVSDLNEKTINEHYYIPIRNAEGFYVGDYVQGPAAAEYLKNHPELNTIDQWQKDNGVNTNPDTHDYANDINLNKPTLSTIGVFNRSYAMNFNDILSLSNYIWNSDDNIFNQIVESLKLFGENPINALISLRLYPFDLEKKLGSTAVEKIKLGRIVTDVDGKILPNNIDCVFDLGSTDFPNYHDNFLDYSPYTECELIIPYCGNLAIPPQEFIGKTLSIKLLVDFNLGACTAVIFADGIPKLYKNGNIGAEVAMSSNISADYGKNWLNASVGAVSNISSIANGNLVSVLGSATDIAKSYTQPTIFQNVGGNSSTVNHWLPQKAYLIIRTSESNETDNYGATVGYACSFKEKLQNLKGYTVVSNPQINFKCSSAENDEIKRILQNGFYI